MQKDANLHSSAHQPLRGALWCSAYLSMFWACMKASGRHLSVLLLLRMGLMVFNPAQRIHLSRMPPHSKLQRISGGEHRWKVYSLVD